MRKVLVFTIIAVLAPVAAAKVWTSVYRCDETTALPLADSNQPGVYRDIMVGTRLVLVVSSDTGGYWWGSLQLSWDDAPYGELSGREPTTIPGVFRPLYAGSCLAAAGEGATAWDYLGPDGVGLELSASPLSPAVPGDWFLVDYRAERVGSCDVGLYDLDVSFDVPIETLSFTHVPSRDFNGDSIVNVADFALLAGRWRSAVDPDPNSPNVALDLNSDSHVDVGDLALFAEYWLARTDCNEAMVEPNDSLSGI